MAIQEKYNEEHGITPETVKKHIRAGIEQAVAAHRTASAAVGRTDDSQIITEEYLTELEGEMLAAADAFEFEKAAALRDRITQLRDSVGKTTDDVDVESYRPSNQRKNRYGKGGGGGGGGRSKIPRPKRQP